mgnify:FL=1
MDGMTLLRACRERGYEGRFGLVVTAITQEDRLEAVAGGANFVLGKPLTAERLLQVLVTDPPASISVSQIHSGPCEHSVGELLSDLLNRRIEVAGPKKNKPFREIRSGVIASYLDSKGRPSAMVIADLQAALSTAAALTLMPLSAVEEAVKGDVSQELSDNLREVFDVLSRVLTIDVRAVKLDSVEICSVSRTQRDKARGCRERARLRIDIPGYGSGLLGLYAGARTAVGV